MKSRIKKHSANGKMTHAAIGLDDKRDRRSRRKRNDSVELPAPVPEMSEAATKRRAAKTGKKFIKKRTLAILFSVFGVAVPSEAIALGLICGAPLTLTFVAFVRSRLGRDKWANWFERGTIAILLCSVLVLFRGVYVAADPGAKIASLAGQVTTGVPTAVWNSLISGGIPPVPIFHIAIAIAMLGIGAICIRIQIKDLHMARPPKPLDYKDAQTLKPRRAQRIPGHIIN